MTTTAGPTPGTTAASGTGTAAGPATQSWRRLLLVMGLATGIGLAIAVLPGHRGWFDIGVYHGAVRHWAAGGQLYEWVTWNQYGFTYPPFAALIMLPVAALPWHPAIAANLTLTVASAGFLLYLLIDPVARRAGWPRWYALALAACLFAAVNPVRDTVSFGQVNLLLMALVYLDLRLLERRRRLAGVGVGLAAAIKLTPAVFVAYLLVTRRWRAAATATATGAAVTLLAAAVAPNATRTFFTEALWDTGRVGKLEYVSNQSLLGLVARLDPAHPDRLLWLCLVAGALAVWWVRVRRAAADERFGFALTGILGVLVSPVSWVHHLVWLVPAFIVLLDATLPWPPNRPRARRRLRAGVVGYAVLCSGLVWIFANGSAGPHGLLGSNAYLLVAAGLLVLLPTGRSTPHGSRDLRWPGQGRGVGRASDAW